MQAQWAEFRAETVAAFEWLIEPALGRASVDFVPNAGNIGDGIINLACLNFLESAFETVNVVSMRETPTSDHVFVGGGGNLFEGLYGAAAGLLAGLEARQHVGFFPVSVAGHTDLLRARGPRLRLLCREAVTFESLGALLPQAGLRLTHDAAFALSVGDLIGSDDIPAARRGSTGVYLRQDEEAVAARARGFDLTGQHGSTWTDRAEIAEWVERVASACLRHQAIVTDRLHVAIVAALLERRVVLLPNRTFKNRAVFEASLSRLGNVSLARDADAALSGARPSRRSRAGRRLAR
jgi:exopolysaccharide biosynthesis predicted pyruvyltransferase EpsI